MYNIAICIRVIHVHSVDPFKDGCTAVDAMTLKPFERIQCREFPTITFLSKPEWNRWDKRPASDLNCSSAEVMDVDGRYNIPYKQQYIVAT